MFAMLISYIYQQVKISGWVCFALLQYRQAYTGNNPAQVQTAMDGFEDVIRRFPKCAEGYALYAQVWHHKCDFSVYKWWLCVSYKTWVILCSIQALTDQQQFGKADEMYDKCIELEPDNATTYVHKG